jgi:hypothetical protein
VPRRPDPDHHLSKSERDARARKRQELRERARVLREERRARLQSVQLDADGFIRTPLRLKDWLVLRGLSYATAWRARRDGRLHLINLADRALAITPAQDRAYLTNCRTV